MISKIFACLLFCFFSSTVFAEEIIIALDKAPIERNDINSIKRGAKFFATTCIACHTLIYLRYDKLAINAGITYERMPVNIKVWPFGIKPPDLSLEANVRGLDWIYTYLHSFYLDPARPTGFNNLLFLNTVMPGILTPLQGQQIRIPENQPIENIYRYSHASQWYDLLLLQKQGAMTPQQFDALVTDIVNFLAYAAEPYHQQQTHLGKWVIGFLFILFVLAYLLKQSYWQDIKRKKK